MQLQMSCNKSKYPPCCQDGCSISRVTARFPAKGDARPSGGWAGMAFSARRTVTGRHVRLGKDGQTGPVLAQAAGVPRPGIPRRRRLYGSRQLGDLARRRLQIRLRAVVRGAVVQPDGDTDAVAVAPAWG